MFLYDRAEYNYGPFLEIADFAAVVAASQFDAAKHLRHSRWWEKVTRR